jgi:hypothetical protein
VFLAFVARTNHGVGALRVGDDKANYLKHGDGKKVNTLSRDQQDALWEGIVKSTRVSSPSFVPRLALMA